MAKPFFGLSCRALDLRQEDWNKGRTEHYTDQGSRKTFTAQELEQLAERATCPLTCAVQKD
jgi:hypothetical protein